MNCRKLALGLALVVLTAPSLLLADWKCHNCNTVVHVNYSTCCPVCGGCNGHLFTPGTGGPGGSMPVPDISGVKFGVSVYEVGNQVVISSVQPGSVSSGRLFQNDRFVRLAFRDPQSQQVYKFDISRANDLTRFKNLVGPNTPFAIRVFRPTTGRRDFMMSFRPQSSTVYEMRTVIQPDGSSSSETIPVQRTVNTPQMEASSDATRMLDNGADMPAGGTGGDGQGGSSGAGGGSATDLLGDG